MPSSWMQTSFHSNQDGRAKAISGVGKTPCSLEAAPTPSFWSVMDASVCHERLAESVVLVKSRGWSSAFRCIFSERRKDVRSVAPVHADTVNIQM